MSWNIFFQNGLINVCFHQPYKRFPVVLCLGEYLVHSVFCLIIMIASVWVCGRHYFTRCWGMEIIYSQKLTTYLTHGSFCLELFSLAFLSSIDSPKGYLFCDLYKHENICFLPADQMLIISAPRADEKVSLPWTT